MKKKLNKMIVTLLALTLILSSTVIANGYASEQMTAKGTLAHSGDSVTATIESKSSPHRITINIGSACTGSLNVKKLTTGLGVINVDVYKSMGLYNPDTRVAYHSYELNSEGSVNIDISDCKTADYIKVWANDSYCPYDYKITFTRTEHNSTLKEKKDPTCLTKGYEIYECSKCGKTEKTILETVDHNFGDWKVTKYPTCEKNGEKRRVCSKCGTIDIEELKQLGHNYVTETIKEASCTAAGEMKKTCTNCGATVTETVGAKGHLWDEGTITKAASCTEKGSITFECVRDNCNEKKSEEIQTAGHIWDEGTVISEATDAQNGEIEYNCINCDAKQQEAIGKIVDGGKYDNTQWTFHSDNTLVVSSSERLVWSTDGSGVPWAEYKSQIEKVIVKKGVTDLGWNAFSGCTELTKVVLPEGVENIGYKTFSSCDKLEEIELPGTVTVVGSYTFKGCTSLKKVVLPYGVKEIEKAAFADCTSLKQIDIPNSVLKIYDGAFFGCTSLLGIVIPESTTILGGEAFRNCTSLQRAVLSDGIEVIKRDTFGQCTNLTEVKLSNKLKQICDRAFDGCSSLKTVILPESLESLGGYPFNELDSSGSIRIEGKPPTFDSDFYGKGLNIVFDGYEGTILYPCNKGWIESEMELWKTDAEWKMYHTGEEMLSSTDPTCTDKGLKTFSCSDCGKNYSEEIPALGHDLTHCDALEANCEEYGWNAYDKCKRCSYTTYEKIEPKGHSYNDLWNMDEERHWHACICGDEKDKEKHSFGNWKTTVPVSCTEDGEKERVCLICGHEEMCRIESPGHDWETEKKMDRAPTCTKKGSESIHCRNCDKIKDSSEIPMLGHDWEFDEVITKATCKENGKQKFKCMRDGCSETKEEEIKATGHEWSNEFTVDEEPTCISEGSKSIHCKNCSAAKDNTVIPTMGHSWNSAPNIDAKATLTTDGQKSVHCKKCSAVKDEFIIPKANDVKLSKISFTYNAKTQKPTVYVRNSEGKNIETEYYTLTNVGRKTVGTGTATVKLTGDLYSGTKNLTYTINPKGTTIKTPKKAKKAFTAKWSKQSGKMSSARITGYQVQYSTSSTFASGNKTVTVKGYSKTSKKIKKL